MWVTVVVTLHFGCAQFHFLDVVRKKGLLLKGYLEVTGMYIVRPEDHIHVLLVFFVIYLTNCQMFVSKYKGGPSNQSEFYS